MHRKIGINLYARTDMDLKDYVQRVRELGFESVFSMVRDEQTMNETADLLAKQGLVYDTLHAPFSHINDIWHDGEDGDGMLSEIMHCVDCCVRFGAPIAVVHLSSGQNPPPPTDRGRARFAELVNYANRKNVRIAFENTRKLANLAWAFEEFDAVSNVGFCWDTGHENCFTPGRQYMPLFGNRLICTHIHDNNGVPGQDMHCLPFDGKIDFSRVASQLHKSGFAGTLMLEVMGNRELYQHMDADAFLVRAANSIQRIRAMVDGGTDE